MKHKRFYNGQKVSLLWHDKWVKAGEVWLHAYDNESVSNWTRVDEKDVVEMKRKELMELDWEKLREFGYSLGQKDNKRSRLVEEILDELSRRGEL